MEITSALVSKKAKQMFHPKNLDEVMNALDVFLGPERERIQLAILKLSEGRLDKLHFKVEVALQDYRDVLAPAEYPKQMQNWGKVSSMTAEKAQAIEDEDRQQYLAWLNSGD